MLTASARQPEDIRIDIDTSCHCALLGKLGHVFLFSHSSGRKQAIESHEFSNERKFTLDILKAGGRKTEVTQ